jgi:hypothetical protein
MTEDEKLKAYTDLFIHWDSSFWYAFYVILVIQGALIVAFTDVYLSADSNIRSNILFIVSSGGVILSFLWFCLMHRKFSYTIGIQDQLKMKIPEVYISVKNKQKGIKRIHSSWIVNTIIPFLFFIFWVLLLIIQR